MPASKIMMLGDIGVGKTSIARRFVFDRFEAEYKTTLGVELYRHEVTHDDGALHRLVIWDMDGDIGESVMRHVYMKGAAGALILADLTRTETWKTTRRLAEAFEEELPGRPYRYVFNKADLVNKPIDLKDFISWDDQPPVLTSALNGQGVREVFEDLSETIARRQL